MDPLPYKLTSVPDYRDSSFDCLVIVGDDPTALGDGLSDLAPILTAYCQADAAVLEAGSVALIPSGPQGRLLFSNSGRLNRDQDDLRRLYDAAGAGLTRAVGAGARRPLLTVAKLASLPVGREPWATQPAADRAALLGAMQALYTPLELRDIGRRPKIDQLGFRPSSAGEAGESQLRLAAALEAGRILARDIGGSDPERMTAKRAAELIRSVLGEDAGVTVEVEERVDPAKYPLMAAVDRAASGVPRHAGCVVHLSYRGSGDCPQPLLFVGKGITYDTGGADVKAGGHMAGMHRDKCGAAAIAGLFRTLQLLRPPRVEAHASLAFVRNSIGSNSYVADEIITSRAGVRVRVGNTDAEGRMVMADLLCLMRERALGLPNPSAASLFTVATLTGHVIRAYGVNYAAAMDNGPARLKDTSARLQRAGDLVADPFEISTIRREDYNMVAPKTEAEDVLQCNNEPSSGTSRGHQFPAAFLIRAAGLDKHGLDSDRPIAYTHIDVAGSSGDYPDPATASPLLALAARYILPDLSG
ncbi:hypothetical protein BOX15_Mlig030939g2 [Macrostomum lignano]|uniref:Cytosol aminopeptidase domain-containing protein n=1 Tax=Macrostomum lignano TaxID=282301 RepID=A0A267E1N6_9PLAT|nr:hypothetical protein BOX15_Mlig030939g2 [Macrostomum lignano]